MSFNIVLQTNNSENNRVEKDITDIMTLTGELKQETSIIDPIIIVEADMTDLIDCNYMSISEFGRKYFVNNIRSIRNGLVELSCHVDVLSSFANSILSNKAIVRRNEAEWNLYLNDGSLKVYQNPHVITKAFPSGFNTFEFVLAVAGE